MTWYDILSRGLLFTLATAGLVLVGPARAEEMVAFHKWDAKQAKDIVLSMRVKGKVGKSMDLRVLHTERSYNYKLRATWLTQEVIDATARLAQLAQGLTDEQTRDLIQEAQIPESTMVLVEIDPREGSGVIPRDWVAFLGAKGARDNAAETVRGISQSRLRGMKALSGGARRDYSYDVFWVVFPLLTPEGKPVLDERHQEAELSVRIYNKVGRVRWEIPTSVRGQVRR